MAFSPLTFTVVRTHAPPSEPRLQATPESKLNYIPKTCFFVPCSVMVEPLEAARELEGVRYYFFILVILLSFSRVIYRLHTVELDYR